MLRLTPYTIWARSWRWLAITLVIALLWTGIGLTLWHDRTMAGDGAVKDTANLALTFEESITRTVEAADQTLLFLRDEYPGAPDGFSSANLGGEPFISERPARADIHGGP